METIVESIRRLPLCILPTEAGETGWMGLNQTHFARVNGEPLSLFANGSKCVIQSIALLIIETRAEELERMVEQTLDNMSDEAIEALSEKGMSVRDWTLYYNALVQVGRRQLIQDALNRYDVAANSGFERGRCLN